MNLRRITPRSALRSKPDNDQLDTTRMLVLDFSPTKISLDEAATVAFHTFHVHELRSRYNKKRDLLILEFHSPQQKLRFVKRLPQWLWNRGCVLMEYSRAQLGLWLRESTYTM